MPRPVRFFFHLLHSFQPEISPTARRIHHAERDVCGRALEPIHGRQAPIQNALHGVGVPGSHATHFLNNPQDNELRPKNSLHVAWTTMKRIVRTDHFFVQCPCTPALLIEMTPCRCHAGFSCPSFSSRVARTVRPSLQSPSRNQRSRR